MRVRYYSLKHAPVELADILQVKGETYEEMVTRLTAEDSNAYGQNSRQVSVRVRNHIAMTSNMPVGTGSDLFMLSNYLSFKLVKVYSEVLVSGISCEEKVRIANLLKDVETVPAEFAEAKEAQIRERKAREAEEKAAKLAAEQNRQEPAVTPPTGGMSDFVKLVMEIKHKEDIDRANASNGEEAPRGKIARIFDIISGRE